MRIQLSIVLLLALGLPASASAQTQPRDTTASSPLVREIPLTPAQRQAYAGIYAVTLPQGEQTTLDVYEENGVLKAHPANQDESRILVYRGDNEFLAGGDPDFVLIFVMENGRATKFTVRRGDGVIQGRRLK
ncbi:MAG TPA: hypothetical protein VG432_08045 [Gemmatimonadaceae bacterium]|nr:hypothetical protein [Gemmatimonadaceae bacterium]